jgi:hypothetical protein
MIWANAAAQPFPGIGFQITNEEVLLTIYRAKNKKQMTKLASSGIRKKSRKSLEH